MVGLPGVRVMIAAIVTIGVVGTGCGRGGDEPAPPAAEPENEVVGTAPPAVRGIPSVVLLDPLPARDLAAPAEAVVMDQIGMAFSPGVLLARPGQAVEFRNSEQVDHNVKVRARDPDSTLFNVSTEMGHPFEYRFERTGAYDVTCDIHPGMSAFILVVSSPHAVVAASNGDFSFAGVPPGAYTLSVWSLDSSRRVTRAVEVGAGRTEVRFDP